MVSRLRVNQTSACHPSLETNHHPVLSVEYDRALQHHFMPFDQLDLEVVYDGCSRDLHFAEADVLADAAPGSRVEGHELVAWFMPEAATLGHPPLWPELHAVLAPYPFYSPHGVE